MGKYIFDQVDELNTILEETNKKVETVATDTLEFIYTNYKGKLSKRVVEPIKIWFGKNEYHLEDQWLLSAYDPSKDAFRDFAFKDIIFQQQEPSRELIIATKLIWNLILFRDSKEDFDVNERIGDNFIKQMVTKYGDFLVDKKEAKIKRKFTMFIADKITSLAHLDELIDKQSVKPDVIETTKENIERIIELVPKSPGKRLIVRGIPFYHKK